LQAYTIDAPPVQVLSLDDIGGEEESEIGSSVQLERFGSNVSKGGPGESA
jgi:hypothetical protein